MNKMIPFQRSALIKPLKNSLLYCYLLVQREKVADKHITNTGDELSGGINIDDIELSKYEVLLTTLILSLLYSVHMHFQTSGSKLCQIFGLPLGQIFCTMGRLSYVYLSSYRQ